MGNTINKDNGVVIREVNEPGTEKGTETTTGSGTRGSNTSKSTTDSRAERGTRGTNTSGSGRSTGTVGTKEQKEVIPGLPVLDDEKERKRLERNAKRRERYAKEKAEQGQAVKPRKVNTKKKQDEQQKVSTEQLNTFIKTISLVVASRPNCEHWLLTDSEIESITTPLSKMLAESEIFEKLGEHSNQIALVTACVTVFMPRIIKTTMIMKEKKKYVGRITKQQPRSEEKVVNINRNNDKGNEPKSNDQISNTNESWVNGIFY